MDKNTILEAMEHIDHKLIQEADRVAGVRRVGFKRCVLIAASISAFLLTYALATGVLFASPDINIRNDSGSDGNGVGLVPEFDTGSESTKVSTKLFSDVFLTAVANTPEGERFNYCFDAWSEMEEYIGYNIFDNPVLDKANPSKSIYGFGTDRFDTHGILHCFSKDGKPTGIDISVSYNMNPTEVESIVSASEYTTYTYWVSVHINASVFTDKSSIDGGFSSYNFPDGSELTEETYVSANGRTFTIVRVLVPESTCPTFYSFLYLDHAYITVMTSFYQDETLALSTMKEILDGFVIG